MPNIYQRYVRDMPIICKKSQKIPIAKDIPNLCPIPAKDKSKIPPELVPLCFGPLEQHSNHHKSNRPKASPACTLIWDLCVLDPHSTTVTTTAHCKTSF